MRFNVVRVGMCLAVSLLSTHTEAQQSSDFIVNIGQSLTEQSQPQIAVSGTGNIAIAWVDKRNGNSDIYLQQFTRAGIPRGISKKINDDLIGAHQSEPAISADLNGSYVVIWNDYRSGLYPFKPDIYFQSLDSNLAWQAANQLLTIELPDSLKSAPDIALYKSGGGVVVWADYRNQNWDIYGQIMSSTGAMSGSNFKINDDIGPSQQHAPRIAIAPEGWFIVTWYDNRAGNDDIFVQRFDQAGNRRGNNFRVSGETNGSRQAFPDIAADGAGCFTVVWVDWRNGTYPANPDIYARKLDTLYNAVLAETKVNRDGTTLAQREPAIAADRRGNVSIIWADSTSTSWDIVGQMLDVDGVIREANLQANNFKDSAQIRPDVALDGRFRYVTWADNRNGNWDIFASITKYNEPHLLLTPEVLSFESQVDSFVPLSQKVIIHHAGYNPIHFMVASNTSWLSVTPISGLTPDTLEISINANSFQIGQYSGSISLVDTDNNDSTVLLPVLYTVRKPNTVTATDTISFGSTQIETLSESVIPLSLSLNRAIKGIFLPLEFDTTLFAIDSVAIDPAQSPVFSLQLNRSEYPSTIVIEGNSISDSLLPGQYLLANIHIRTLDLEGNTLISSSLGGLQDPFLTAPDGSHSNPVIVDGVISVGVSTPVEEITNSSLPNSYKLHTNYPNPFNPSTTITYELPLTTSVILEVFNILGQRVNILVQGLKSAGTHHVTWDGISHTNRPAPSGVYFYRLQTDGLSFVNKMLLLK